MEVEMETNVELKKLMRQKMLNNIASKGNKKDKELK